MLNKLLQFDIYMNMHFQLMKKSTKIEDIFRENTV